MKKGSMARFHIFILLSFVFTLFFAMTVAASAQVITATVLGIVKDQSGGVLPGVTVTIQNTGTGATRTSVTDAEGRYRVSDLAVGSYQVKASFTGFKEFVHSGFTLAVGQEAIINIAMDVGNVTEQVEVKGEAPLIETTNAEMGGLVSSAQVRELPLNGRSFDQLALLQPGVQPFRQVGTSANTSFSTRISVSGARLDANNILMDGIEINDWARTGGGSVGGLFLGVEAIQEFKVLTHNYGAEYGRNAGAVFNVITRSGTNQFHGSILEFLRNSKLDARNFFSTLEKDVLRRNQFGGYAGGRMIKDKLFFTANYEGVRQLQGSPQTMIVLSPDARSGNLSTGKITVNPAVLPYIATNIIPLPNAGLFPGGDTGRYIFMYNSPIREDFGMGRLDYHMSDKDSFFVRFSRDNSNTTLPDSRGATPFFGANETYMDENAVVQHTRIFGPTLLNLFKVGVKRSTPATLPYASPAIPTSLSFIPGAPFGRINFTTSANVAGVGGSSSLTPFGQASLTPGHWFTTAFQIGDHMEYNRGAHTFKAGVDYELIRDWIANGSTAGGLYTFNSIQNFLLAAPANFSAPLSTQDISNDFVQHYFAWFVADDFRVNSRLTVNLGLRDEFVTGPYDRRAGHTAAFINPKTDADVTLTKVFFHLPLHNFGPRIGLAWDVKGDGKTSVRAGFGIYHNQWIGRDFGIFIQEAPQYRGTLTVQPPQKTPVFPNEYAIDQAAGLTSSLTAAGGIGGAGIGTGTMLYKGMKTPTMIQYSLEVQRQLFPSALLSVGYVGSKGNNLLANDQMNPKIPTFLPDGRIFFASNAPTTNPKLNPLTQRGSWGNSRYSSLQVQFRLRQTHGLELQANYVWAKSLDTLSSSAGADSKGAPTLFMNPFNHRQDKGPSDFIIPQTLTLNTMYQLPIPPATNPVLRQVLNGWNTGVILSIQGGSPFTPLVGFCRSNVSSNCGADRPDLVGKIRILGSPDLWFDARAFAVPTSGFFGNAGRNILTGPGLRTMDFSLLKDFHIQENKKLQFRAEFFNLFNTPNFALPGLNLFQSGGTPVASAGVITGTVTTARQIQFGLKLLF